MNAKDVADEIVECLNEYLLSPGDMLGDPVREVKHMANTVEQYTAYQITAEYKGRRIHVTVDMENQRRTHGQQREAMPRRDEAAES